MINLLRPKYRMLTLGLILLVSGLLLVRYFTHPNLEKSVAAFRHDFLKKEQKLRSNVSGFLNEVGENDSISSIWENTRRFRRSDYHYFLFRNDSLLNWTTNSIPIPNGSESVEASGALLLQNGWYYFVNESKGPYTAVGCFLIKHEFPYENESLQNGFHAAFDFPFDVELSTIPDEFAVHDSQGNFAFSFTNFSSNPVAESTQLLLVGIIILAFLLLLIWVVNRLIQTHPVYFYFFALGLLFLRWMSLKNDWADFFAGYALFNPQLFGSSVLFPTLGDLLINVTLIWLLVLGVRNYFDTVKSRLFPRWLGWLALCLFFLVSIAVSRLLFTVVADSDIPLTLHRLLELNIYSYVVLVILGLVLLAYFVCARILIKLVILTKLPLTTLGVVWFLCGTAYFLLEMWLDQPVFVSLFFPLVISAIIYWIETRRDDKYNFTQAVLLLLVFAGTTSLHLDTSLWLKEQQSREVYAKKLISDKDLNTEVEYSQTEPVIGTYPLLLDALRTPGEANIVDVKKSLQTRFFSDYWERFEMEFFLFTQDSLPVGTQLYSQDNSLTYFEDIITNHAEPSDLSENLFYIYDYTDKLSYLVRQPITDHGVLLGYVAVTLKSKIIPQDIGFPRLLLHEDSKVFFPLENYSMAKYVEGKLVSRYGAYNYPLVASSFLSEVNRKHGFSRTNETSHYVLHGDFNRMLVLSRPLDSSSEKLTGFSFMFTVFGVFLLLTLLFRGRLIPDLKKLKLAVRIQLILISLVFFALLFFSLGTGSFVKDQYDEYRDGLVREKLSSVQMELVQKLGYEKELKRSRMGNYMEYLLQKFSAVFMTDINLYSLDGNLLASSRPEVYELGLVSEHMNPRAFRQMNYKMRSMFIHEEMIGNLRYVSAYVPLQNNLDEVIAYINLPYFAKQNEFENEIASFLSAIINVFLLLLALSIIVSVVITNRITEPLKRIQSSLAGLELGKSNKPIAYKGNDEIGALVKEYNAKLGELEDKAMQLAQTEREMAWREMAKQVAHEIKNPLTPMKLRLQHLQRSFNPDDPNAVERLNQVANSIIEQIDTLTHIANEFSNFAKLPRPNEEQLNIVAIIGSVAEMFRDTENCTILLNMPTDEVIVLADKDLMIRVFNNLIKNAVQAIPPDRKGEIVIDLHNENQEVIVRVADNGAGIPEELRERIFTPNFTTKTTGMGLGLAMVKQIVDSHGGRISFDTVTNQGTQFEIRLPLV
jgi:two-component system, NtrC family, nitrogen regulation sensor histidine kinase NtrY